MPEQRYIKPSRFEARVVGGVVGWLARHGFGVAGSRELAVRGRTSGEWRRVPVNPLPLGGRTYLVSARGEGQWVRNLRAAGSGELRGGRRAQPFDAVEVSDALKPEILRAYLKKWGWEVSRFFDGVDAGSSDQELLRIAAGHPVFRVEPRN